MVLAWVFGVAEVLAGGFEQDHGAAFTDEDEAWTMVALEVIDAECTGASLCLLTNVEITFWRQKRQALPLW